MIDAIVLPAEFSVRIANEGDEQFLAALFYTTRQDLQLLPLPPEQLGLLLQQQYVMQTRSYALQYPDAHRIVIQHKAEAVGKIVLHLNADRLHIVDFVIATSHRTKGYGSLLLAALQEYVRAQKLSLQLSVDCNNHLAQKLYVRCGFVSHSSSITHLKMQWLPC